jgi:hypothetical protein
VVIRKVILNYRKVGIIMVKVIVEFDEEEERVSIENFIKIEVK